MQGMEAICCSVPDHTSGCEQMVEVTSIVAIMMKYAFFHSFRKNNATTIAGTIKCNRICIIDAFAYFADRITINMLPSSISQVFIEARLQHIQALNARQYTGGQVLGPDARHLMPDARTSHISNLRKK
jgi:hypothetical protein